MAHPPAVSRSSPQTAGMHLDAELDDDSLTLTPEQASQADRFRDELRACGTDTARYELCVQKRDELLDRQTGLQLLVATCEQIMSAECPTYQQQKQTRGRKSSEEDDTAQWHRFLGLAREGDDMKSSCLSALKKVARCWGPHIIQHYQWASRGGKYCNQLRAAAKKVSVWDDAVSGLNWSILQRSRNVQQRPVKASANPIEQHDLERLKTWSQDPSRHKKLPIDDIPPGLGFDRFGLLVHQAFAAVLPQADRAGSPGSAAPRQDHSGAPARIDVQGDFALEDSSQTALDPAHSHASNRRRRASLPDITPSKRLRLDASPAFSRSPGVSDGRPAHDHITDDAYRRRVLAELEQATPSPGSHGEATNRLVRELLSKVEHPNTDSSRGAVEALFSTGDQAACLAETRCLGDTLIVTEGQQPFRWRGEGREIEQFFSWFPNIDDLSVSAQIPSLPANRRSFKVLNFGDVKRRFLDRKETTDPCNILDLQCPVESTLPTFLSGENCGLLLQVRNRVLMGSSAERVTASLQTWAEWKDVIKWALLSEGGHHTAPHMDSHGYATWITAQEGCIGVAWMSFPTEEERNAWMAEPHRHTGGRWRYIILKPGQTVFFPPGTIHFVFRVRHHQTLALGGHILQWSSIQRSIQVMLWELKNPSTTNEEMKMTAPKLVRTVAKLVRARVSEAGAEALGGEDAVKRFSASVEVRMIQDCERAVLMMSRNSKG
ncbi:hypothetical protein C8A05DRAFT_15915 [Staphylotrichum tortipilum]|uniref:JmjC domain-containing protein n=1 Tax=Staphylotrichum tortipilum TaxID=2831512 RepID=A0AAN6MKL7_9PEZI|nr:hypothetical protein C8A05DRAFT_15915 [Staphylotrichum longicolle]